MMQPVLFIGGPKHGETMQLPQDQFQYEHVSMNTLMPRTGPTWEAWPASASHRYKLDHALTPTLSVYSGPVSVFTHETLWSTPYNGGFVLHALRDAEKACEDAKADLESSRDRSITSQNKLVEAETALTDFQVKYEKLLDLCNGQAERLKIIRYILEGAAGDVGAAISETGFNYESPFDA